MSIRHLASSLSGSIILAGEFERIVHVWDVLAARHLATFYTIFDFGGNRLAVSGNGKFCVAAAYYVEGVAAYSTSDGSKVWCRKDLKKAQTVRVSLDERRIFCCFDDKSCHILNAATGKTIKTWPGVRDVWESAYEPKMLLEKPALVLQTSDERKISSAARETFAVLSVAFAPDLVCVSESGGSLRCLYAHTGKELWRYVEKGQHFLTLAFAEEANAFVGVCWPYETGGSFRLLRFEPRLGAASVVAELGRSGEFVFCQRGGLLLSSDGSVIDSVTGRRKVMLPFPARAGRSD